MIRSNYIVNTKVYDKHTDIFIWRHIKDDSVGVGSYATLASAQKHFRKLEIYVEQWKTGKEDSNSKKLLKESLKNTFKFLNTNESRLERAVLAITECKGIRILEYSFPGVATFIEFKK